LDLSNGEVTHSKLPMSVRGGLFGTINILIAHKCNHTIKKYNPTIYDYVQRITRCLMVDIRILKNRYLQWRMQGSGANGLECTIEYIYYYLFLYLPMV